MPENTSVYPRPYLRVSEVADHFGISERSVRRLIASGYVRAVRVGGLIRVVADELEFPDVGRSASPGLRPAERRAPASEGQSTARAHAGKKGDA
jgi:excisionase family DNA binding protein